MTDKRCLVYETLGSVSNLQVSEAKGDGLMRLQGVFGVCGIKNQNNRVYDKDNYAQMVESLQKKIKESGCPGELEHPNSMNINLENVSHKIEDIQMNEDGTITGSIVLLNTPKGQIAKAIVEGGLPLFISSRGAGTITNEGRVTLSTIQTYDLVGTPGFSQAKLTLKTNQTLECLNEGLEDTNETWVIVEGDDLLNDDGKKKDEPKEEPKEEPKKEEPKEEPKKEDDNKNNDNKDIDMKELKEAIDKLTEKVTSLEAELHVAQESLNEVKSIKPTNYDGIQKWITEEFAPDFRTKIDEAISEKMNSNSNEEVMEAVKAWANDELTNQIKNWVVEEFAPEVQNWIVEEFAPEVQNWVVEEFAPEVQNWIVEEFAPEVQNWIVEEYSPELQNWVTEEFAPEIQGWITEEFAPTMESWLMEEYTPEQSAIIEQKVNENVSAFMESQKAGRLDEIDGLLESIAAEGNDDVNKIIKEQKEENKYKGIYVVENMPAEYLPSWQLLNEAAQQAIIRSAKMYDFTKEGVLESFWANIDFGKKAEETKPVVESKNPIENYQNSIIANMKRLRGMNA